MYILSMMFILYCRDMREVGGGEGVGAWCGTDEGVHACMYVDRGGGRRTFGVEGGGGTLGAKGWRERFGPQFVVTGSCVGVGATQRGLRTGFVSIDR